MLLVFHRNRFKLWYLGHRHRHRLDQWDNGKVNNNLVCYNLVCHNLVCHNLVWSNKVWSNKVLLSKVWFYRAHRECLSRVCYNNNKGCHNREWSHKEWYTKVWCMFKDQLLLADHKFVQL